MENDNTSVIGGLTISELDEYTNSSYVAEQKREARVPEQKREARVGSPDLKPASSAASLFMLLSVHVKPWESSSSLFSVYGEITSFSGCFTHESDYLYKRESQDVETFSRSDGGGYLTLNGPSSSCFQIDAHFLFASRELSIRLYDQQGERLYPLVDEGDDNIILDYSPHDFLEQVREKVVRNSKISLTFKYVSIPMAVHGRLYFNFFERQGLGNESEFIDVRGEVVAKYKNTFGNYKSEEIVLFDKKNAEYGRLVLGTGFNNLLSLGRCWVAAPAYSSLQLHIDLFDCQQGTRLTQDVELETGGSSMSSTILVFGQYFLEVGAMCFCPPSRPPQKDGRDDQISRTLEACTSQLSPSTAIEVFSVLVFYEDERRKRFQIHGRLQFSFNRLGKFYEKGVDIFKQEKEYPLTLLVRGDNVPLLDGSRLIDDPIFPLSVVCDLKGTKGGLNIKGHEVLNDLQNFDTELCSVFRGDHGFAALHYAIFPSAVQANLKVFVYKQSALPRLVKGSICFRYKGFDYSSQYKKKWYEIVLFRGSMRNQALHNFSIPLSRNSFVVPSYSSAIFDFNLVIGNQVFCDEIEVAIGTRPRSIKLEGCKLKFKLEWSEVK